MMLKSFTEALQEQQTQVTKISNHFWRIIHSFIYFRKLPFPRFFQFFSLTYYECFIKTTAGATKASITQHSFIASKKFAILTFMDIFYQNTTICTLQHVSMPKLNLDVNCHFSSFKTRYFCPLLCTNCKFWTLSSQSFVIVLLLNGNTLKRQ